MTSYNKYQQAVAYLDSIINLPIKDYLLDLNDRSYYLNRLRFLLKLLGNPQNDFKLIHITGTSGKGTVANYLHEILNASNKKVGTYFSPHSTTAIERVKVNGLYISPTKFAELVDELKPYLKVIVQKSPYGHTSYFETFLALAFLYFKKTKCEYVILEAGLGGAHDATNVIQKSKLALITNIGFEHTQVLGNSLTKIAQDKAGIIKKNSTFITTEARPKLIKIFKEQCKKKQTHFILVDTKNDQNKTLAKKAALNLGLNEKTIEKGLDSAGLPCRFEIIQKRPHIILDGAHNPAKLSYLKNKLKKLNYKKLHVIFAVAEDKNIPNCLKQIAPLSDNLFLTRFLIPFRKSADLKKLYQTAKKIQPKLSVTTFLDPWQALDKALKLAKKDDCILITGSFFLAGELRKKWFSEEQILKKRKSF